MTLEPTLGPPPVKPHLSVARMTDYWYCAARSTDLAEGKTRAVTILGIPMVLFRNLSGQIGALLDRCPHRNVPLSAGRVTGEHLQCGYHGWEFGPGGGCARIPGLIGPQDMSGRDATAYPVREQQGYIWVFARAGAEPETGPYTIPYLDEPGYTHARRTAEARGTLHATIENALDVPHTSYLHRGLFRGTGVRNDITAVVRRWADHCEAEYVGEPRPEGLAARLLSPGGGQVVHHDRFFLPSIAQVEYKLGDDTHFCVTSMCTPVSDFYTQLHAIVSFRLRRVPGWLIKPLLEPVGRAIFAQDAKMLKRQTDNVRRFGGEQFVSTEIDVLGPHIWRLMRQAERGAAPAADDAPFEKRIQMNV